MNGSSDKAVDGCKATDFSELCCTHTEGSTNQPWWGVDLEAIYDVVMVKVLNRKEQCCSKYLYLKSKICMYQ